MGLVCRGRKHCNKKLILQSTYDELSAFRAMNYLTNVQVSQEEESGHKHTGQGDAEIPYELPCDDLVCFPV